MGLIGRITVLLVGLASACVGRAPELAEGPGTVIATSGPSRSMLAVLETGAGVVVIDLGWWRAADELGEALAEMGRVADDVVAVFLTHAHPDHVIAWRAVRHATFHLSAAEAPFLVGEADYEALVPRAGVRLAQDRPGRDDIELETFASDTAFVFGADTIRAFLVPGHTPGSAAYLARGVLYAGDALGHTPWAGYRHARPLYSDDVQLAAASLRSLFERVAPHDVQVVCTAHAHCARFTEAFRREALGEERQ